MEQELTQENLIVALNQMRRELDETRQAQADAEARAQEAQRQLLDQNIEPVPPTAVDDRSEKKELAKMLFKNLTKYDGEKNANKLEKFITSFLTYAKTAELSDESCILGLTSFLTHTAEEWWTNYQTVEMETLRTTALSTTASLLDLFLAEFRDKFTPIQHKANLRAQLHDSNISRGLTQYVNRMRRLYREHGGITKDELYGAIIHRIDGKQEMHLRTMHVVDGWEALNELEIYANTHESASKRSRTTAATTRLPPDHPHFMDVDATRLRDTDRRKAIEAKYAHIEVTDDNYWYYNILPVTTDKLRTYLRDKKGCFYCRTVNTSHISRDCPNKGRSNDDGRQSKN